MSALDPELFNSLESPESSEGLESLEGLQGMGAGLKFPLENDYPILVKKDEPTAQGQVLVTYSQDRWDFSSVSGTIKTSISIEFRIQRRGKFLLRDGKHLRW